MIVQISGAKSTFILNRAGVGINVAVMIHKRGNQRGVSGQASTEYLLTLSAVFIAFSGAAILFSGQVDHYLSLLFRVIVLPF